MHTALLLMGLPCLSYIVHQYVCSADMSQDSICNLSEYTTVKEGFSLQLLKYEMRSCGCIRLYRWCDVRICRGALFIHIRTLLISIKALLMHIRALLIHNRVLITRLTTLFIHITALRIHIKALCIRIRAPLICKEALFDRSVFRIYRASIVFHITALLFIHIRALLIRKDLRSPI